MTNGNLFLLLHREIKFTLSKFNYYHYETAKQHLSAMKRKSYKRMWSYKVAASAKEKYAKELARLIDQSFDGMEYERILNGLGMYITVFAEDATMRKKLIQLRDSYRLREMFARDEEEAQQKTARLMGKQVRIENFNNTGGTFNNYE